MIAPFSELTIGQMYNNTPGIITSLAYTVMDTGTWETVFAKLPKYIQVSCTFTHIGKRLPSATQKHFELPWVAEEEYFGSGLRNQFFNALSNPDNFKGIGSRLDLGNLSNLDTVTPEANQLTGIESLSLMQEGKPPPAFGKSKSAAANSFGLGQTFTLG